MADVATEETAVANGATGNGNTVVDVTHWHGSAGAACGYDSVYSASASPHQGVSIDFYCLDSSVLNCLLI